MSETYKLPFTAEEIEERLAKAGNALLSGGLPKVTLSTVVILQGGMAALSEEDSAAVSAAAENGAFLLEITLTGSQAFSPTAVFDICGVACKVVMSEGEISVVACVLECHVEGITFTVQLMDGGTTWAVAAAETPDA